LWVNDSFHRYVPSELIAPHEVRHFLIRCVSYLAGDAGIRQFLDLSGSRCADHKVDQDTQQIAAFFHPDARTAYPCSDVAAPRAVLAGAREVLDFNQPIAVLLVCVLGAVTKTPDEMHRIVGVLMEAMPSGSYLVLSDGADTGDRHLREISRRHRYHLHTLAELQSCFENLEMVEPGQVPINLWRPAPLQLNALVPAYGSYASVGRKP
jgi:hypothetical protein